MDKAPRKQTLYDRIAYLSHFPSRCMTQIKFSVLSFIKTRLLKMFEYLQTSPQLLGMRKYLRFIWHKFGLGIFLRKFLNYSYSSLGVVENPEYKNFAPFLVSNSVKENVLKLTLRLESPTSAIAPAPAQKKLTLAYFSPLPPLSTGIADYSAELLPELAKFYDITLISDQHKVTDKALSEHFPIHDSQWFSSHAQQFDRVLYHIGNSQFHKHMFGLLSKFPGAVLLHDFFLGQFVRWMENIGGAPPKELNRFLYQSHGYPALLYLKNFGEEKTAFEYPCNQAVLAQSLGIMVHSAFSQQLAKRWYGEKMATKFSQVPFLKKSPAKKEKAAARQKLNIDQDIFLVCSFGFLNRSKLNLELLIAWAKSALFQHKTCQLFFVGEFNDPEYETKIRQFIKENGLSQQIRVIGFVSMEQYHDYLHAADLAVQLRTFSRGETSAAIFDTLAYRVPLIINAHGSSAEVPPHIVSHVLPDKFALKDLSDALSQAYEKKEHLKNIAEQGYQYLQQRHAPAHCAQAYFQLIETIYTQKEAQFDQHLTQTAKQFNAATDLNTLVACAQTLTAAKPSYLPPQFLVDISAWKETSSEGKITDPAQIAIVIALFQNPSSLRIEPIYFDGQCFRYALQDTLSLLALEPILYADNIVEVSTGDIFCGFITPNASISRNTAVSQCLTIWQNKGVEIQWINDPQKISEVLKSKEMSSSLSP